MRLGGLEPGRGRRRAVAAPRPLPPRPPTRRAAPSCGPRRGLLPVGPGGNRRSWAGLGAGPGRRVNGASRACAAPGWARSFPARPERGLEERATHRGLSARPEPRPLCARQCVRAFVRSCAAPPASTTTPPRLPWARCDPPGLRERGGRDGGRARHGIRRRRRRGRWRRRRKMAAGRSGGAAAAMTFLEGTTPRPRRWGERGRGRGGRRCSPGPRLAWGCDCGLEWGRFGGD